MARSMAMLTGSAIENQSSQLGGLVWLDMTAIAKMFCGLEIGDVLHSGRARQRVCTSSRRGHVGHSSLAAVRGGVGERTCRRRWRPWRFPSRCSACSSLSAGSMACGCCKTVMHTWVLHGHSIDATRTPAQSARRLTT